MTEETKAPLRHRWRDAVKSSAGPDDHVLRWVLIALGDWSPVNGGPFSVAVATLCEQTALGDSAVRERLAQAKGVWLTEQRRPGKTTIYRLRIPAAIEATRPLEQVRRRPSEGWKDVDNSPDPTAGAVDPDEGTLPRGRRTPTAGAVDYPTARAAGRRKETSSDVARPRARSGASLATAAPKEGGDDQLEIARLILEAVKGGRHEDFDAATQLLAERKRQGKAAEA